ncbi:hypothetical protein ACMZOO_04340 [Catenovulum sp. SX2]|uniref:hypothetical protein n=1 Tax=Catenovulum sp. SX2 TaxID=3398614 RepID=UPI003F82D256
MIRILLASFVIIFSLDSFANKKPTLLWNDERSGLAFCELSDEGSICFVICENKAVNVSSVENGNIGKLGISPKNSYDIVQTLPTKWLNSAEGCMVSFTTYAWKNEQLYSRNEKVYVNNGTYLQR